MSLRGAARAIWIWGPLLIYLGLILYFSSLSQIPWAARYPDYLEHGTEYLGLSILMARALNNGLLRPIAPRNLLIAFILCVAYASIDEFFQYFVPNRLADVTDVLSDAVGAAVGLLALYFGKRLLPQRVAL